MSWVPPDRPPVLGAPESDRPPPWPPSRGAEPPAPGDPAPRRRTGVVVAVVLAVLGALVAVAALVLVAAGDGGSAPTEEAPTEAEPDDGATTTVPADPGEGEAQASRAELDAAVAELSDVVAEVRGRPFLAPVEVELLDGAAFQERLLADFEEAREDLELVGRLFVALGLVEPDLDLYEAYRGYLDAGVLGFYDPETGELVVRGAEITPYTRSTLVHELVHALDDQHFELHRPEVDDADDETGFGLSALIEGNAVRVQQGWEAGLSRAERAELMAEQVAMVGDVDLSGIPVVVLEQLQLPYLAGPRLVEALLEAGGEARVDAAFAAPPTTSEQVLDPATYLAGEGAVAVAAPPADGEVIDQGAFGQLTLLQTLREGLDAEAARAAADGWGGDAYVAWADGGATCLRSTFVMDTRADLVELTEAWEAWAAERDRAEVAAGADAVTVTACG